MAGADFTKVEQARLEQAYRVLGVPRDSAGPRIRAAYRGLARTWHPDKFAHNSPEQRRATERMRAINDAFQLAKQAPLRFHVDVQPAVAKPTVESAVESAVRRTAFGAGVAEHIVRFVAGVALGLFVSVDLGLTVVPFVSVTLVTGGASVVFGDSFWEWVAWFWW